MADEELRGRIADAIAAIRSEDVNDSDWYAVDWWFEQGYLAGMKDPRRETAG